MSSMVGPAPGKEQRRLSRDAMRRIMFLSQDGVVLSTTLRALDRLRILEPSLQGERPLGELYPDLTATGFGSLRVALHGLAATGWVTGPPPLDPAQTVLDWTEQGRAAMAWRDRYVALGEFLAGFPSAAPNAWTQTWEPAQVERFAALVSARKPDDGPDRDLAALVGAHLDGGLAVPTMLWLHENDRLGEEGPTPPAGELGEAMGRLIAELRWTDAAGAWTESGRQARAFGLNFGGVATYLPLLARLPELFRGELTVAPDPAAAEPEWHVHRALNVRISAAAHRRYFADSEALFLELFNREPLADQPRFIADMGCGEGSWLVHLQRLIETRTRRGERLAEHPLTMVGIDPAADALEQARRNLDAAGADALLIPGDVTDPDRLATDLAKHGLRIEDGLHIRSFIDHERRFLGVEQGAQGPGYSSGVYLDYAGAAASGAAVESDLVAHLRRWARFVPRHGLVVLEAHCVAPPVVARNLGSLHGIAFDAHQAYSKQYPVDHPAFLECCRAAGLQPVGHCEKRYPNTRPFVAVSLNRLLAAEEEPPLAATRPGAPRADTWQPPPGADLEDGRALHRIIFRHGDIRYPATWCSAATGFVVARTLESVEARLDGARGGETIRVLDYGAGTGTAAIELLKACRERGLDDRCERQGVSFELHLVDLPSSWYAQGYELLRECEWVRFHSLRADGGGFRPLAEVVRGAEFDAAMANMVFHLIPGRALGRTMDQLAGVLRAGGGLAWSAPDLGPAAPGTVLLHDPNRALRELLRERFAAELDAEQRRQTQARADRRIRPRPLAADVDAALAQSFDGETTTAAYEMLAEDIVSGLLVPSNQAEFLPEIEDRGQREETIRRLMLEEVLPRMQEGPAGTGLGLSFHWTLGAHARRP